uniref:Uncharacterized protein n=1 Tax=mine drainage metagenome TaxID=410659 RepID=E6QT77_9ZZZZ
MILMSCLLVTLTIAAYAILLAKKAGNYSVEGLCRYLGGARSLPDLKEIGCKSAWPVPISPLFWSIEQLLTGKTGKTCPHPAEFCEQPHCGLPA